jgi:hypothetical protein
MPAAPVTPADLSPGAPVLPLVPFFRPPPAVGRPLPDAVAVRVIPDTCPPYDDDSGHRAQTRRPQARRAPVTTKAPVRTAAPASQEGQAALHGWPGHFAQVLAETLAGSRPAQQIVPWTTEQAQRHIQRLGPLMSAGSQPRVRRVVTFRPSADVLEMTIVLVVGPRVRALAVRMERTGPASPRPQDAGPRAAVTHRSQPAPWVCTAVEAA